MTCVRAYSSFSISISFGCSPLPLSFPFTLFLVPFGGALLFMVLHRACSAPSQSQHTNITIHDDSRAHIYLPHFALTHCTQLENESGGNVLLLLVLLLLCCKSTKRLDSGTSSSLFNQQISRFDWAPVLSIFHFSNIFKLKIQFSHSHSNQCGKEEGQSTAPPPKSNRNQWCHINSITPYLKPENCTPIWRHWRRAEFFSFYKPTSEHNRTCATQSGLSPVRLPNPYHTGSDCENECETNQWGSIRRPDKTLLHFALVLCYPWVPVYI